MQDQSSNDDFHGDSSDRSSDAETGGGTSASGAPERRPKQAGPVRPIVFHVRGVPTDPQAAHKDFTRRDLSAREAEASHPTFGAARITELAVALAGGRQPVMQKAATVLMQIASENDPNARCYLAQEYHYPGGELPVDVEQSEALYRSTIQDVAPDLPLGTFARKKCAELLASSGRHAEAADLWQQITDYDAEAAHCAARALEQHAADTGKGVDLERVTPLYRLAALNGHVPARAELARVLTAAPDATQLARNEAQFWLSRSSPMEHQGKRQV